VTLTDLPASCNNVAAEWFAAAGTILLAFVAVFQQWLQQLVVRPRLNMDARVARPDSEKNQWTIGADVYYFRLAITNDGNDAAHDVQVYLEDVQQRKLDGKYEAVERFSPMNLLWTHIGSPTRPVILPKMPPLYCDLVHICDPKLKTATQEDLPEAGKDETVLGLELEVKVKAPPRYLLEPGAYRFRLKLAASNCKPRDYLLEVIANGKWFDDQDKMFSDGFGMRLL
jgi:hypothetical protein